ncbi:NUDIX domain-containing protein [Candidatus Peregrinibacteria bacterium]|jgi:bis(5'-nucleosidyl)-tetraphosphatase|nr:NUDIX domain-containing protein [Candidatus Peregrinibacteria bacterium]
MNKDTDTCPTENMKFDNAKNTGIVYTKENIKVEKSCGVIVFKDYEDEKGMKRREYILLKYPEGHWDFPKGHMEEGEDEYQTACREFTEETGISDITILEGFRDHVTYEFFAAFENLKGWIRKTVVFFAAETEANAKTSLSHEHNDFVWLSEREARKRITYDNARKIFNHAVEFIKLTKK